MVQSSGVREQGLGNRQQATGNGQQGTGNRQQGTGNRQRATGNGQQATGNRQQATGNRQRATGNGQQATGNRDQTNLPCLQDKTVRGTVVDFIASAAAGLTQLATIQQGDRPQGRWRGPSRTAPGNREQECRGGHWPPARGRGLASSTRP